MLSQLVDSYLKLRRSTGFRMGVQEYLLHSFASLRHSEAKRTSGLVRRSSGRPKRRQRGSAPTVSACSGCLLVLPAPRT